MVEITGLDRTGLLYEMTTTLSKLNLNIASAHVATFGERVVDVFYVTDLMGAQITSPTRQAAIKRALIALFAAPEATENRPSKRSWRARSTLRRAFSLRWKEVVPATRIPAGIAAISRRRAGRNLSAH